MGSYIATINVDYKNDDKKDNKKKKKPMKGCIMKRTSRGYCYFCPVKGCLYYKIFKFNK